jgi:hypothetical protein
MSNQDSNRGQFYKIFAKFRNSKQNVLKIVLIMVNINKDENKSLILSQFSLKNDGIRVTIFYFLCRVVTSDTVG